jgi:hypothetical protein
VSFFAVAFATKVATKGVRGHAENHVAAKLAPS